MKQIIAGLVAFVVILGAGGAGYMYFQGELDTVISEKEALENQLSASNTVVLELKKVQEDTLALETKELGNIASFAALDDLVEKLRETKKTGKEANPVSSSSGAITGTGETFTVTPANTVDVSTGTVTEDTQDDQIMDEATLDIFYSPSVHIEGPIGAPNFAMYKLALQKQLADEDVKNEVLAHPIEMSQGDWTAVVSLKDMYTEIPVKLELSASGAVIPSSTPARKVKTQQMYITLAKWEEGVISEQYTFDYSADVAKSKLLEYIK